MSVHRDVYDASTPDTEVFPQGEVYVMEERGTSRSAYTRRAGALKRFGERAREVVRNNSGMLLIAASEAFFAPANVAVKVLHGLDPPVGTMQLIWVRMVITWICSIVYMHLTHVPSPFLGPKGVRLLLAGRGLGGFIGLFGVYYPVQYLSLADATVLTFLAPILTTFTGAYFLGEAFSIGQLAAGVCSLGGVVLIARPPFLFGGAEEEPHDGISTAQRLGAVGVALVGALGATCVYTIIRAIGHRASPMHSIVAFASLCILTTSLTMLATSTPFVFPAHPLHLLMLLMIGLCGFFAQVLMTMGLQRAPVGRGTMAVYIQVVYAVLFDVVVFGAPPSVLSVLGIVVIVGSAVYVAVSKEVIKQPTDGAEEGLLAEVQEEDDGGRAERRESDAAGDV